jgi:hypothetical protein
LEDTLLSKMNERTQNRASLLIGWLCGLVAGMALSKGVSDRESLTKEITLGRFENYGVTILDEHDRTVINILDSGRLSYSGEDFKKDGVNDGVIDRSELIYGRYEEGLKAKLQQAYDAVRKK